MKVAGRLKRLAKENEWKRRGKNKIKGMINKNDVLMSHKVDQTSCHPGQNISHTWSLSKSHSHF